MPHGESAAVEVVGEEERSEINFQFNNDPWLDNGLEYLHKILADNNDYLDAEIQVNESELKIITDDFNKFSEQLGIAIKNIRHNLVVWGEDDKTGEKKEIKKDFILIQEGKKIGGIVAFKEDIYSPDKVINSVRNIMHLSNKDGGETCIVCGERFQKPYKKLQQASYPFVTKIKSLSGVRSYKDGERYSFREYFENFCPRCYLLGILVWADSGLIYRTFIETGKSILFLPKMGSLKELIGFKESYRALLNTSGRYSNIRVKVDKEDVENTPGEYSTLLCFYEKFFVEVEDADSYATEWIAVHIPLGAVKNVKYDDIHLKSEIMDILREIVQKEGISFYADVIKETYFFNDKPKGAPNTTREIQEKLAEYFLKDDFRRFTKQLLPRKGGHVGFSRGAREDFESIIYIWRWKRMGIPKENLGTIKSVGNIIAIASKNNLSLLYKLDKARNISEFWSVLREISRKIIGFNEEERSKIKPKALDDLIQLVKTYEDHWKEIRDMLVVYSSMYYSIKSRAGGEGE
jgi:hypothetical protein